LIPCTYFNAIIETSTQQVKCLPEKAVVSFDGKEYVFKVIDKNKNVPITVFIARDHHINNFKFEKIVENSKLVVSIIGIRFELNDSNICAIGKLVDII
jgi:hypothetical protein